MFGLFFIQSGTQAKDSNLTEADSSHDTLIYMYPRYKTRPFLADSAELPGNPAK